MNKADSEFNIFLIINKFIIAALSVRLYLLIRNWESAPECLSAHQLAHYQPTSVIGNLELGNNWLQIPSSEFQVFLSYF
jgi:hypothetical protein